MKVLLYYLVGLLDETSYNQIEKIQRNLSEKYHLYTDLPMLHVTLEIIEDPSNLANLVTIIDSVLQDYNKFSITINGAICFDPPFKSVNLKVENSGTLIDLVHKLNSKLKTNGFKVRDNIENWDFHISLANTNFSLRQWSDDEFHEACLLISKNYFCKEAIITNIQLWKPINDKDKMVVKNFIL